MNYSLVIVPSARKELLALPKTIIARIDKSINNLSHTPRPHNSVKLRGVDSYRIRVGDYRIIYDINNKLYQIIILAVGHRKEIYR